MFNAIEYAATSSVKLRLIDRGYKESIKRREMAGTFGRAFSLYDSYFLNFPLFLNNKLANALKIGFRGLFYCGKSMGNCLNISHYKRAHTVSISKIIPNIRDIEQGKQN